MKFVLVVLLLLFNIIGNAADETLLGTDDSNDLYNVASEFRNFKKFEFIKNLDFNKVEEFSKAYQFYYSQKERESSLEFYIAHKLAYESYQLYKRFSLSDDYNKLNFTQAEDDQVKLLIFAASIFKLFQVAIKFRDNQEVRKVQRSFYHSYHKTYDYTRYLLTNKFGNCEFGASAFNVLFRYGVKLYENSNLIHLHASSYKITGQNHRFNFHAWNLIKIGSHSFLLDLTYPMYQKRNLSWDYFISDPRVFIKSHFPKANRKDLQGLEKPISWDEFKRSF